jgi:hypothetical protein
VNVVFFLAKKHMRRHIYPLSDQLGGVSSNW